MGAAVEARYGVGSEWHKGKITAPRGDGTYDVLYDDGRSEVQVAVGLIRARSGPAAPAAAARRVVQSPAVARMRARRAAALVLLERHSEVCAGVDGAFSWPP